MSVRDDEENASGDNSSDYNDADERMEDAEEADGEGDNDADGDIDMDGEDDGDGDDGEDDDDGDGGEDGVEDGQDDGQADNEDDDDQDQPESPSANRPFKNRTRAPEKSLTNGTLLSTIPEKSSADEPTNATSAVDDSGMTNAKSASPPPRLPTTFRPAVLPITITAPTYDIVPTIAAPQATSINAITATPDMRWVFTGGTDGYIRKFNWIDSVNAKLMLTVAQRHPFVDSVVKAGVLSSYWENEDPTHTTPKGFDEPPHVSPVYSLAVHHEALWLLSGDETGVITMQSVRHGEGSRIASLRKHTSAVSILNLAPDERSVLSGSWDKKIYDWDLNTGQIIRTFEGTSGQVSSIELRPTSSVPIPSIHESEQMPSDTFTSNNADEPRAASGLTMQESQLQTAGDQAEQHAGVGDDDDMDSLFGDADDAGPMDTDVVGQDEDVEMDEFSRAIATGLEAPTEEEKPTGSTEEAKSSPDTIQNNTNEETEPDRSHPTINGTSSPRTGETVPTEPTQPTIPDTNSTTGPSVIVTLASDTPPSLQASEPSETTFLSSSMDGTIHIWDRRQSRRIAHIGLRPGVPPWCMSACWSPCGNYIYAGRRNNTVDEYSLLSSPLNVPTRTLRFPTGSGPVSAVRAMPNGRHLVCASFDILRLYDLKSAASGYPGAKPGKGYNVVPFLIVPGHRTGVISHLYMDPTCRFLISVAGNRGWEGLSTEVMLGYDINVTEES